MSKYHKDVSHIKTLDPYRLQELYQMHPCAEHVVKKLLVAGERSGGKSLDQDIADCVWTLQRWQEMRAEDAATHTDLIETTGGDYAERIFEPLERAFLNRYNWKEAPAWAKYAATDASGIAYWYASRPKETHRQWAPGGMTYQKIGKVRSDSNWMESLEARP